MISVEKDPKKYNNCSANVNKKLKKKKNPKGLMEQKCLHLVKSS